MCITQRCPRGTHNTTQHLSLPAASHTKGGEHPKIDVQGAGCSVPELLSVEGTKEGCCEMHVVPSTEGKLLPCGFTQHSPGAVPGEILAGCREAEPPPRCDFSAANGSIVLGGLGALCRSGTSLAPAAPWSYQIEPGSPLLPPSLPLHAQPLAQSSFGSHPRGEEHCPGPQGSFEHSQCVCPAPAPEHPPEHSAPWVSVMRRARCWEGEWAT